MDEIREGDAQAGGVAELFINGVPKGIYEISELDSHLKVNK